MPKHCSSVKHETSGQMAAPILSFRSTRARRQAADLKQDRYHGAATWRTRAPLASHELFQTSGAKACGQHRRKPIGIAI